MREVFRYIPYTFIEDPDYDFPKKKGEKNNENTS